ncbi:MAG: HEPN domain-containing protein [Prevotellaceae bacterium]|jgi:HEPN domain-containing protein|nr:HEPN domain-containing protein [Prevotellaceae bacterium]
MNEKNEIKDVSKVYNYWLTSSDSDYAVMLTLYQSKSYSWALFLGHIAIEKLIKAWFVKNNGKHPPFTFAGKQRRTGNIR